MDGNRDWRHVDLRSLNKSGAEDAGQIAEMNMNMCDQVWKYGQTTGKCQSSISMNIK